jgi:hypothetical protein
VRPKASLDMRNGHARQETGQGSSERARAVALDDQQVGLFSQQPSHFRGNPADVIVRVCLSGAVQAHRREGFKVQIAEWEVRMPTGEHERRAAAKRRQPMCYRGQLDDFRAGADHQPDIGDTQYSP